MVYVKPEKPSIIRASNLSQVQLSRYTLQKIRLNAEVKPIQARLFYLYANCSDVLVVAHRRLGKTFSALLYGLTKFLSMRVASNPQIDIVGKEAKQQKKSIFPMLSEILSFFPPALIDRWSEVEGMVRLKRPHFGDYLTIYIGGQDNPDGFVGQGCDLLIADERAFWKEGVFELQFLPRSLTPGRFGQVISVGSVKGMNKYYELPTHRSVEVIQILPP